MSATAQAIKEMARSSVRALAVRYGAYRGWSISELNGRAAVVVAEKTYNIVRFMETCVNVHVCVRSHVYMDKLRARARVSCIIEGRGRWGGFRCGGGERKYITLLLHARAPAHSRE